jgi:predicted ATPase
MGIVYEARDEETGSTVALKTIRTFDADALYRLKREFRVLADVVHPNLIRLGELHREGDSCFFTMERVRGVELLVHVCGEEAAGTGSTSAVTVREGPAELPPRSGVAAPPIARAATFDETRLRDAFRQLATGLHALHCAGFVHRDVKPSNVLVEAGGRVVLLDFGLSDELRARGPGVPVEICGTPAYMAPEQFAGSDVGPRADWYAFGVMLFRALAGKAPFAGTVAEIAAAKVLDAPPAPSAIAIGVPGDLDRLCVALLHPEPANRPSSEEVLRCFGVEADADIALAVDAADARAAPFVGRVAELEALRAGLDEARGGGTVSMLVHGEPGVGKTALVRQFLEQAAATDPSLVVLTGRCYEQESLPFKAFDAIIDALSRRLAALDPPAARALLRAGVRFLAMVFPVLRRVAVVEELAPASQVFVDPNELRVQAFQELASLLALLGERGAVVLFVDDLQWADRESFALLEALRGGGSALRCFVVATMRSAADAAPQVQGEGVAAELLRAFRPVPLRGLGAEDAAALVERLGPHPSAQAVIAEAGGHPLFLGELARFAESAGDAPRTGMRLEDVLWRRIAALDGVARRLLEFSALAGVPVKSHVLARAAAIDPNDAFVALGRLRAAQLVRFSRRGAARVVEPYHDRVREAVMGHLREVALDAGALPSLHLRLGRELLAATPPPELDASIFIIVQHLAAGASGIAAPEERRRLAELHLRAARVAKGATAYEAALGYFVAGAKILAPDAWKNDYALARDLFRGQVEAEYLTGRREEAILHFEELLGKLASDAERADLFVMKIDLDTAQRRFREAIATARRGLYSCGVRLPGKATPLALLGEYAVVRMRQGRRAPADFLTLPAMTDETKRSAIKLLIALAPPAYFCDTPLLALTLMRITNLSLAYGVSELSSYGIAGYGLVVTAAFGRVHTGHELGQIAVRLDEKLAGRVLACKLHFVLGVFLMPWVRPFREAQAVIRRGIELGRELGDMIYEAYNAGKLATMTLYEGRALDETERALLESRAIAEKRNDVDMATLCSVQARFCAAMRGGTSDPARLFAGPAGSNAPPETISDARTPIAIFFYWLLGAQLAYFAGDDPRCLAMLAETQARTNAQFGIVSPVDLYLFRVLARARLCDRASFAARLGLRFRIARDVARIATMARACPANFAARHLIARGESERIAGKRDRALATFQAAAAAASAHGDTKHEAMALEIAARIEPSKREEALAAQARWGRVTTPVASSAPARARTAAADDR